MGCNLISICSYAQAALSSVIPTYAPEPHYLAMDQTPCICGLGDHETRSQDKKESGAERLLWPPAVQHGSQPHIRRICLTDG